MGGAAAPAPLIGVIGQIGASGDGVMPRGDGAPAHVARTLPGETVAVRFASPSAPGKAANRAELAELLQPSPDRVAPPCPHFAQGCGGCALQHWRDGAYAAWKRGLVVAALGRAGFAGGTVGELVRTPPRSRRRMDFAVRRAEGGVSFGLHRAHSTGIIDLQVCEVLEPALAALIPELRGLLSSLGARRRDGSVLANMFAAGADLLIRTDGPLATTDRTKLAGFAAHHAVSRISWAQGEGAPETAALITPPVLRLDGHAVQPPPGAFLQASAAGERAIVEAVLAGLPTRRSGRAHAVELFAGIGTLSQLRVLAYEGDADAVACVRRAQSGSRVEMTQRDLARRPLSAKELKGATCVVLDPPYGGAETQCGQIASSGVPCVIYVSCNPGALARDAAVLAKAGYTLSRATPIDQFLWSAHVECVAVFQRRVGGVLEAQRASREVA